MGRHGCCRSEGFGRYDGEPPWGWLIWAPWGTGTPEGGPPWNMGAAGWSFVVGRCRQAWTRRGRLWFAAAGSGGDAVVGEVRRRGAGCHRRVWGVLLSPWSIGKWDLHRLICRGRSSGSLWVSCRRVRRKREERGVVVAAQPWDAGRRVPLPWVAGESVAGGRLEEIRVVEGWRSAGAEEGLPPPGRSRGTMTVGCLALGWSTRTGVSRGDFCSSLPWREAVEEGLGARSYDEVAFEEAAALVAPRCFCCRKRRCSSWGNLLIEASELRAAGSMARGQKCHHCRQHAAATVIGNFKGSGSSGPRQTESSFLTSSKRFGTRRLALEVGNTALCNDRSVLQLGNLKRLTSRSVETLERQQNFHHTMLQIESFMEKKLFVDRKRDRTVTTGVSSPRREVLKLALLSGHRRRKEPRAGEGKHRCDDLGIDIDTNQMVFCRCRRGRMLVCWYYKRFLGSQVDVKGRDFELLPFGAGRRICPGMPLAIRMLHVMLGSLLRNFDWKLEDGITPENINMDEHFGLTVQKAQPLKAIPSVVAA
ncbi:hypothetical protein MLD38_010249 [Melastoma candidum]|uniref:Uncharacterized protein n=1 Tax=Melastoma candidum TaxID=119954 RepID=A0ACB9QZS9_9MYRT|nr:hypothetical protein MLD38_010249 [Melastoma candidum]